MSSQPLAHLALSGPVEPAVASEGQGQSCCPEQGKDSAVGCEELQELVHLGCPGDPMGREEHMQASFSSYQLGGQ